MMNSSMVSSGVHNSIANTITINTSQLSSGMMSDGMSEPSSPDSSFDTSDLIEASMGDDVTAQLAAAGPVGIAAAAAIVSGRRRKRPHIFETNPSVRKRQQTRLLRKLKACIEEYTTRVGQQAVVLCCTPSKTSSLNAFKVFGSQPLESVIKSCKSTIMQSLDDALAEQAPPNHDPAGMHELPSLAVDGIPTPVDKMLQAQLRTFIPEMLKYSTGRSKPGWGKPEYRPLWWPADVPWANVRSDIRSEEEKKRVSWTDALRTIVKNCYRHHGREDLLHIFGDDGSLMPDHSGAGNQYTGTMVQTINNPDGTVSIIQIDTGPNSLVTLPDGTQATVVQAMTTMPHDGMSHDSSMEDGSNQGPVSIEMPEGSHGIASISGGRILLANGETAQITADPTTGIMTIPVSMYQSLISQSESHSIQLHHGEHQITLGQIQQSGILAQQYENQQVELDTSSVQQELEQQLQHQLQQQQQQEEEEEDEETVVQVATMQTKQEPS